MFELNDDNFKKDVLESKEPFLVCFFKEGCPGCLKVRPILEEVSKEAKVGLLNVLESPQTASFYKIPAVPALIIFKNGKAEEKAIGLRPKEVLLDKLRYE